MTSAARPRRSDVQVRAKKIGRIVLVLQGDESFIIASVRGAHERLTLLAEPRKIDIKAAVRVLSHGRPGIPGPSDVLLVSRGIVPNRVEARHVRHLPIPKCGGGRLDPAQRPTEMPDGNE